MFFSGRPPWWQALQKTGLVLTLAAVAVSAGGLAQARGVAPGGQTDSAASVAEVALNTLPPEAQAMHQRIMAGGPFPGHKDGTVFGNRERILPRQPRGFYHEYTVRTPGVRDRGARRIVCGGRERARPEACFYTADHYTSFQRIVP